MAYYRLGAVVQVDEAALNQLMKQRDEFYETSKKLADQVKKWQHQTTLERKARGEATRVAKELTKVIPASRGAMVIEEIQAAPPPPAPPKVIKPEQDWTNALLIPVAIGAFFFFMNILATPRAR